MDYPDSDDLGDDVDYDDLGGGLGQFICRAQVASREDESNEDMSLHEDNMVEEFDASYLDFLRRKELDDDDQYLLLLEENEQVNSVFAKAKERAAQQMKDQCSFSIVLGLLNVRAVQDRPPMVSVHEQATNEPLANTSALNGTARESDGVSKRKKSSTNAVDAVLGMKHLMRVVLGFLNWGMHLHRLWRGHVEAACDCCFSPGYCGV
jgi:hypothetical protein